MSAAQMLTGPGMTPALAAALVQAQGDAEDAIKSDIDREAGYRFTSCEQVFAIGKRALKPQGLAVSVVSFDLDDSRKNRTDLVVSGLVTHRSGAFLMVGGRWPFQMRGDLEKRVAGLLTYARAYLILGFLNLVRLMPAEEEVDRPLKGQQLAEHQATVEDLRAALTTDDPAAVRAAEKDAADVTEDGSVLVRKGEWIKSGEVPMNVKFAREKEAAKLAPPLPPSDAPIEVALGLEEGDGLPASGLTGDRCAECRCPLVRHPKDGVMSCGTTCPANGRTLAPDERLPWTKQPAVLTTATPTEGSVPEAAPTFPAPPGPLVRNMEAPHGEPLPDRFKTGNPGGEGSPARDPRIDPAPGDVVAWGDLPEHQATVDGIRKRHFEGGVTGHTVLYTDGAGVEFTGSLGAWRSRLAVGRVIWQPEQRGYPPSVAHQLAQAAQEFVQGEGESPKPDPECWAERHGPASEACTCYVVEPQPSDPNGSLGRVPVTDADFAELSADVARGGPEATDAEFHDHMLAIATPDAPPATQTVTEDVEVAVRASKVPCPSCKRVVAAGERFTRAGKLRRHFACVPVKEGVTT